MTYDKWLETVNKEDYEIYVQHGPIYLSGVKHEN